MTEAEWLTGADPTPMLEYLRGRSNSRKLRLFACASCRRIWHMLTDERSKLAVEQSERYCDGAASRDDLVAARSRATDVLDSWGHRSPTGPEYFCYAATQAARLTARPTDKRTVLWNDVRASVDFSITAECIGKLSRLITPEVLAPRSALLRDIFGNPFRPVAVDPSWLTGNVISLATAIYDDRAFDRLPILADALEDAGCDNEEILNHCRQPGEHVRGCWAVDLVLGRR